MIQDVECPYCEEWQEINHDDGYGFSEHQVYEQECSECGKTFTYTTTIMFSYEATKAPCKNGESHNFEKINGHPAELFEYKRRCSYCGEETVLDIEKQQESNRNYFKKLEEGKVK